MKIKLLSLSILFLFTTICLAQDQSEVFKVLASKGTNTYTSGNSAEWKAISPGKKLMKDDKVKISDNGYLGLVHKSGKTVELKKSGTYTITQLSSELASQNASMSKKYVDYVVGEMTAKNDDMVKNRHKYMDVTGSVDRGTTDTKVQLISPPNVSVLNTPVLLKWEAVDGAKAYVLKINNLFDESVFSMETTTNSAIVDLGKLNFKKEKFYLWKVVVKGSIDTSAAIALKYVPDAKADSLNKVITSLKNELKENTALNKIIMASFYEDNKLFYDAIENYEAALKMEPEVEDYRVAYGQFLDRNGIRKIKK